MTRPDPPTTPPVETDERFPSGPWKGFFLQPGLPGRHWMELHLTFRDGRLSGEGRDPIGPFVFDGQYSLADGRCWWVKTYLGRHSLAYQGYNEGKGIWGRWEGWEDHRWHGGFHIWPLGQGFADPTAFSEAVDVPVAVTEAVPV